MAAVPLAACLPVKCIISACNVAQGFHTLQMKNSVAAKDLRLQVWHEVGWSADDADVTMRSEAGEAAPASVKLGDLLRSDVPARRLKAEAVRTQMQSLIVGRLLQNATVRVLTHACVEQGVMQLQATLQCSFI